MNGGDFERSFSLTGPVYLGDSAPTMEGALAGAAVGAGGGKGAVIKTREHTIFMMPCRYSVRGSQGHRVLNLE
jgi:hypothetical protein